MGRKIIISSTAQDVRIGILKDGILDELYIENKVEHNIVGSIYKGRVKEILPGMSAAFIDIGLDKNAYLAINENDIATKSLKVRQEILVKVVKEASGKKGARVTQELSIPGRYLVLMPHFDHVSFSRNIVELEEINRLSKIIETLKDEKTLPEGFGVILRTAAMDSSDDELKADLEFLLELWEKIEQKARKYSAPCVLYTDHDLVFRVIRDVLSDDVKEIIVDDANVYQRILEMSDSFPFPRGSIIDFFQKEIPIFAYYGIDNQIESALRRKVWLDCGGYLIFDHTEAFLSIDVNTGKYVGKTNFAETILKTNLEAAFEIARQLRLRNIGGIIIIDFIDMQDPKDKERVLAALKEALAKDRVKSRVIGFTELGLVEMTRKKSGKSLPELFETQCNACKGKGSVLAKSIDNS